MPAVSKKQFKKMFVLEKQGKITPGQLKEFTEDVDYKDLPSRSVGSAARRLLKKKNKTA
jgi:hypothetical protein